MGSITPKSGVLLVHPRLRSRTDSTASTFERWTRMHFRDLRNISDNTSPGASINACVRATEPFPTNDDSDEGKPGTKPEYVYTCFLGDIGVVKSQAYYDVSRKLNLEHTRPLEEGETPVGYNNGDKEAMVFEIVDAKFAVYEETEETGEPEGRPLSSCFEPVRGNVEYCTGPQEKWLIGINFSLPPHGNNINFAMRIHRTLREYLINRHQENERVYSSLYHWAGRDAQPDEHPFITPEESAEWMILVFLVHELDEIDSKIERERLGVRMGEWIQSFERLIGDLISGQPSDVDEASETGGRTWCGVWRVEMHC